MMGLTGLPQVGQLIVLEFSTGIYFVLSALGFSVGFGSLGGFPFGSSWVRYETVEQAAHRTLTTTAVDCVTLNRLPHFGHLNFTTSTRFIHWSSSMS
jgi:hypothetical protein